MLKINKNSKLEISIANEQVEEAVLRALSSLRRDIDTCCKETTKPGAVIRLINKETAPECFVLKADETRGELTIGASEKLGFIYGIYEVSRRFLGVYPFWFWLDQKLEPKESYSIVSDFSYQSKIYAVSLRGWFVNDEVLIDKWKVNDSDDKPWEMVFEALLRLGGNLVIPGTDKNAHRYRGLASQMGLTITHHHAEPLGAEMFGRAYPELTASFSEYPEKFKTLWGEAITSQKDKSVVYNLGFRGQGDRPFWEDDPRYETPKDRGKLMSDLIRLQYDMVKEQVPKAVCCTNLYGETMELYRDGYLNLPKDVIKIWADNGFGKMVSRRQMNHNPRIPALPNENDRGEHGIYYHVSFYDLQAANHITMLPNAPEFVHRELGEVLRRGMKAYWVINCSNVKPHTYFLDVVASIWREGDIDIEEHRADYVRRYYGATDMEVIKTCLSNYPKAAIPYGTHEDEHSGEQFTNHVARMLISQYMKDESVPQEELFWATDAETLDAQVFWYKGKCKIGVDNYNAYYRQCDKAHITDDKAKRLFEDTIFLQAKIHCYCSTGAYYACKSIEAGREKSYQQSFFWAGEAKAQYQAAVDAMEETQHDKWNGFYANDALTDVRQSVWLLEMLMGYVRNKGEGPHFYQWQQEYLYPPEDRRIVLLLKPDRQLSNQELYGKMKEQMNRRKKNEESN